MHVTIGFPERYIRVAIAAGSVVVVSYLAVRYVVRRHGSKHGRPLAPSIGALPIIGSLPYLPNIDETHLYFLEKSYNLGPVISFIAGSQYTIVLNNHNVLKEAFVKRSLDFADRPVPYITKLVNPNNKGFITHNYNASFKRYQQLTHSIFKQFGVGGNIMEGRIQREVEELVAHVLEHKGQSFDPEHLLCSAVLNVIGSVLFARRLGESEAMTRRLLDILYALFNENFSLLALDVFPLLRLLPSFKRSIRRVREVSKQFSAMINQEIESNLSDDAEECFASCFIRSERENLDKEQLQYMLMDMLLGGIDSTMITLRWALVFLANDFELQHHLHNDIDGVVSRGQMVSVADKSRLPRVEAFILEVMRYKTMFPLGAPHATQCDTEVAGYHVPKGTMVIPNLYAAHMNKDTWKDPDLFSPERFLDPQNGNIINKELMITFSLGKRSCPGETLARHQVYLFLVGLLQHFLIRPPEGSEVIEVLDVMADTLAPSQYNVRLIPRD